MPQRQARVSLQWAMIKVSQVLQAYGGRWKTIVIELIFIIEFGISKVVNPLNSKERNNIFGLMQNNRNFLAIDEDIVNHDGKILKTEGGQKVAKYWPEGHCGKLAALFPWLI